MSDGDRATCERADIKVQVVRVMLAPLAKIVQNEVCFILMLILAVGVYAGYVAVVKFEAFVKEQVPLHIEAINRGSKEVTKQFSEDLKSQRESYLQLRTLDEKNIDRIERLTTGKKTTATANSAPFPNE